jgi:hypothetical protein
MVSRVPRCESNQMREIRTEAKSIMQPETPLSQRLAEHAQQFANMADGKTPSRAIGEVGLRIIVRDLDEAAEALRSVTR